MSAGAARGWIGKLPCVGDFLCHGLPTGVASMLDNWLSSNLHWLHDHVSDWADLYMQAPASGFVIPGGFAHERGMHSDVVGLLMPSVDSVGRPFPFLMLQALDSQIAVEQRSLTLTLIAMWGACSDALHSNLTVSALNLNLDEQLQACIKLDLLGSFIEPSIVKGPTEWFFLQPEIEGELSNQKIDSLKGWPNEVCFLQLLDCKKKLNHE